MSNNQQLNERKQKVFARGQSNLYPIYIEKAVNAEVWDADGNCYIDFAMGIAVCNTGHSHPKVVAAAKSQLDKMSHTCIMVTPYEPAVELAEKLVEIAPGDSPKKAIFVTTGAEAVENAVKIARAHTGRRGVIAFHGGFHGRTNLAMSLTGKVLPYKHLFGPLTSDIFHVPFPNACHEVSVADSLKALELVFKADIGAQDVAAIIIEPVQGEGGFYPAPYEFLHALRELCDIHGIVLIADEIQTGYGRTGKYFYCEHAKVEPDLMTVAKGIAGGLPLAAVVGKSEIMDGPEPGGLGGTYAGPPVSCAAALAVLEVMQEEALLARAQEIGAKFKTALEGLQSHYPDRIKEVRVIGAMIAMELYDGNGNPDSVLTSKVIHHALENGLILLSCGFYGNVIRFLPALTITDDVLDDGLQRFQTLFMKLI